MFERLRRALVESFVGAVALGYLFAQGILHLAAIFASPVQDWVMRNELRGLVSHDASSKGLPFQYALAELIRFIIIMLVWYVLMRWLYFNRLKKIPSGLAPTEGDLDPNNISA